MMMMQQSGVVQWRRCVKDRFMRRRLKSRQTWLSANSERHSQLRIRSHRVPRLVFVLIYFIRPHPVHRIICSLLLHISHIPWSVCPTYLSAGVMADCAKTDETNRDAAESIGSSDQGTTVLDGVHIGATWRIRLNDPYAAAVRPRVNFFDHLFFSFHVFVFQYFIALETFRQP